MYRVSFLAYNAWYRYNKSKTFESEPRHAQNTCLTLHTQTLKEAAVPTNEVHNETMSRYADDKCVDANSTGTVLEQY